LAPHQHAHDPQHEHCKGCPRNEWATSDTGRGKACRNTRRLALLPAGTFDARGVYDPPSSVDDILTAAPGLLKLPVTSVKAFAGWVLQIATAMKRPPFAVFARVKVVPDPSTQFRVQVEALGPVPNELIKAVMTKRDECQAALYAPYPEYAASARAYAAPPEAAPKGRRF
jgi:hypothetical protein